MYQKELPDHAMEIYAWRAFAKSDRIDCVSIAEEIIPAGAHPDYWAAAKRLGNHVLNHMAEQSKVWQDDQGFWREAWK